MMHTLIVVIVLNVIFGFQAVAQDKGAELDRKLCSICHGVNGSTTSELYPNLAGMPDKYFINQMIAFREKTRSDQNAQRFMWGIASRLTDDDIQSLAQFYASQPVMHRQVATDQAKYDLGKSIFLKGESGKGVPPCMACHGEKGQGKDHVPRLEGQNRAYLKRQLNVFYGNERPAATAMHEIVKGLTPSDLEAIAVYLEAQ